MKEVEVKQLDAKTVESLKESSQEVSEIDDVRFEIKPSTFIDNWKRILREGQGFVFGAFKDDKNVGAIGGLTGKILRNDKPYILEQFWYVLPDYYGNGIGIKLLKKFEQWGKMMGINEILCGNETDIRHDKVDNILKKNGYECIQKKYRKEIT